MPRVGAAEALSLLTTARQILDLTAEEADRQHPVELRGWLTGFDTKTSITFLQDETAGVFVYAPKVPPELRFGKRVRMRGTTGAGRYTSILQMSDVELLTDAPMPRARPTSLAEIQEGRLDCQWVEIEGVVTSESENWQHWLLRLTAGSETVPVRIMDFDRENPPRLIGSRIRVLAVGGAHYDDGTWTKEFLVYTQSTNQVTVLNRAEPDPFKLPLTTSHALARFRAPWEVDPRRRLGGIVTMAWAGKHFFITDEEGPVRVEAASGAILKPGDRVDVVGFPKPTELIPTLVNAVYQVVGKTNPPVAKPLDLPATGVVRQGGELVTITGVAAHAEHGYADRVDYHIESGGTLLHAILPKKKGEPIFNLSENAQVEMTGVLEVRPAAGVHPQVLHLWLRSSEDIRVSNALTISLKRLGVALLPVGFVGLLAGSLWGLRCRRRFQKVEEAVRVREARLDEQRRRLFEDNHDMAFSLDLQGNLTSLNRAGRGLLEVDAKTEVLGRFTDYLEPVSREAWMKHTALQLDGQRKPPCDLLVRSRSGRIVALEVVVFAVLENGRLLGFEATGRDITERKEAADALRNSQRQLRQLLEERQQMARDLHDGLIQSIYAIGLNIEEGRRLASKDPAAAEGLLGKVLSSLNTVIRDVRNFILGLEPQELRGAEFRAALKSLVLTLNDARTCRFHMHVDPSCDHIGSRAATQLLLIAREAMTNIIKHAGATSATVSLRRSGAAMVFEVEDDGRGFDLASLSARGHGLSNIESRAQDLDARLTIESKPGAGTRLVLELPPHSANVDDSSN